MVLRTEGTQSLLTCNLPGPPQCLWDMNSETLKFIELSSSQSTCTYWIPTMCRLLSVDIIVFLKSEEKAMLSGAFYSGEEIETEQVK